MSYLSQNLVDEVKKYKRDNGLTLNEIGRQLGLDGSTVGNWLNGIHGISPVNLRRLKRLLANNAPQPVVDTEKQPTVEEVIEKSHNACAKMPVKAETEGKLSKVFETEQYVEMTCYLAELLKDFIECNKRIPTVLVLPPSIADLIIRHSDGNFIFDVSIISTASEETPPMFL